MSLIRIPDQQRTITDATEIASFLASRDIEYERASPSVPVPPGAPAADVLAAYASKIAELSARGGYVTADVIDVFPDCLLYTSPSPRDKRQSRMPSSA